MMLKVRRFLCGCFGFFALMPVVLCAALTVFSLQPSKQSLHPMTPKILLTLCVSCVAMAVPFAMAWWTIKKQKRFARGWGIVASLVFVLIGMLPLLPHRTASHLIHHYGMMDGALMALGIGGIVAFARRDAMTQSVEPTKAPRIAGDGTSKLLDAFVGVVAVVGYFSGSMLWFRWSQAQQLPRAYVGLLPFFAILFITTVVHELGHTSAGLALGMKLRMFVIGPFQWRIRDGRWKFQFLPAKFLSAGGAAALVPTNPHQSQWRGMCMIAAGPLTNLFTGLIALFITLTAVGHPYQQYWAYFSDFTTISLIAFIVNLIPMRPDAFYSDGAKIYQLLQGGPWADLQRAFSIAASTSVTQLRPRDYDIDAINRAELSFTHGHQALVLRLLASSYYLDHGQISQAGEAVAEAERICRESALDVPAELCMAFVFRVAFLRRDAAVARQWWERMEAKKPTHFGADYWLAQSALFWIEGRKDEAREAWEKGNEFAQKLPAAGDYEFDRFRCSLLRREVDNMSSIGGLQSA
ncbi:MAG: M50 family metallopeptidase [Terracidiphilus sp.]|jgi:Zn-dependent protease